MDGALEFSIRMSIQYMIVLQLPRFEGRGKDVDCEADDVQQELAQQMSELYDRQPYNESIGKTKSATGCSQLNIHHRRARPKEMLDGRLTGSKGKYAVSKDDQIHKLLKEWTATMPSRAGAY